MYKLENWRYYIIIIMKFKRDRKRKSLFWSLYHLGFSNSKQHLAFPNVLFCFSEFSRHVNNMLFPCCLSFTLASLSVSFPLVFRAFFSISLSFLSLFLSYLFVYFLCLFSLTRYLLQWVCSLLSALSSSSFSKHFWLICFSFSIFSSLF